MSHNYEDDADLVCYNGPRVLRLVVRKWQYDYNFVYISPRWARCTYVTPAITLIRNWQQHAVHRIILVTPAADVGATASDGFLFLNSCRVYFKHGVQPKCGVQNEKCEVQIWKKCGV